MDALIAAFNSTSADAGLRSLVWLRLAGVLRQGIETGTLAPGQALPGERELARLFEVSRVTVRRAIGELVADGLLAQRHGAGNFVSDRIVRSLSRLTGFTEDLRARGMKPRVEFLERSVGAASPEEAMALNLSPGASVVRLQRLRFADEKPLAVERTVVPQSLLPDPGRVQESLYDELRASGHAPVRALQRLRAVALPDALLTLLKLPPGSPGLFIERRAFLADGQVVEFTCSHYRGDAYDFVAELRDSTR